MPATSFDRLKALGSQSTSVIPPVPKLSDYMKGKVPTREEISAHEKAVEQWRQAANIATITGT